MDHEPFFFFAIKFVCQNCYRHLYSKRNKMQNQISQNLNQHNFSFLFALLLIVLSITNGFTPLLTLSILYITFGLHFLSKYYWDLEHYELVCEFTDLFRDIDEKWKSGQVAIQVLLLESKGLLQKFDSMKFE